MKKTIALALVGLLAVLSGCGETIVEHDRVIKKEEKVDSEGNEKSKETVIRSNTNGTTTKIETKTETK
jgi:protein involved in sex pheromone biosynthesis